MPNYAKHVSKFVGDNVRKNQFHSHRQALKLLIEKKIKSWMYEH